MASHYNWDIACVVFETYAYNELLQASCIRKMEDIVSIQIIILLVHTLIYKISFTVQYKGQRYLTYGQNTTVQADSWVPFDQVFLGIQ